MDYPPESEDGNVEYKLTLGGQDLEKLGGQLKRRLLEGGGEAIYLIGVSNDGRPVGLPDDELVKALGVLREVAKRVGASVYILRVSEGIRGKVAEVLLRVAAREEPPPTVTVVAMGNVDAGKSTLIGVLTTGRLDDGKGSASGEAILRRVGEDLREEVVAAIEDNTPPALAPSTLANRRARMPTGRSAASPRAAHTRSRPALPPTPPWPPSPPRRACPPACAPGNWNRSQPSTMAKAG